MDMRPPSSWLLPLARSLSSPSRSALQKVGIIQEGAKWLQDEKNSILTMKEIGFKI